MQIVEILSPERMLCDVQATSKKRVLEYFSKLLAIEPNGEQEGLSSRLIFESLLARERLGSTGLGKGVAIPHARVRECNITSAAFLQTASPIDYDAIDREPVDLMFALMVPEECTDEHLSLLATLAEMLSDDAFRLRLREAASCEQKYALLTAWQSKQVE